MKRTYRSHKPHFKVNVALGALKGDMTLEQLSEKFDVNAHQISEWKKQLLDNAIQGFGGEKGALDAADDATGQAEISVPPTGKQRFIEAIDSAHSQAGVFNDTHVGSYKIIAEIIGQHIVEAEQLNSLKEVALSLQQQISQFNLAWYSLQDALPGQPIREADRSRPQATPPSKSSPLKLPVALDEHRFTQEVSYCLKHFTDTDRLQRSPLLGSALAKQHQQETNQPEIACLQALIREAVSSLKCHPKQVMLAKIIQHTYLEPGVRQYLIAEQLGLSQSSYRRYLTRGRTLLAANLWLSEQRSRFNASCGCCAEL